MPCAAAGRRVCRPLPVLSPNVAIFFNDVAPPRRLGEGYYTCSQMVGNGEVPKARRPGLPYPLCGARTHRGIAAPCALVPPKLLASWTRGSGMGNWERKRRRRDQKEEEVVVSVFRSDVLGPGPSGFFLFDATSVDAMRPRVTCFSTKPRGIHG